MGLKGLLEKMKLVESEEPTMEIPAPSRKGGGPPSRPSPAGPAPAGAPPRLSEIIHRVPPPRLDEQSGDGDARGGHGNGWAEGSGFG